MPFAVADFDAYSNPYLSLEAFWTNARKADKIVLFGTDGFRLKMSRMKLLIEGLPEGQGHKADLAVMRKQYNFWWTQTVLVMKGKTVAPYRITRSQMYLRGATMLYWGVIATK